MKTAVNSFQRWLFTILLYVSAVSGIVTDMVGGLASRTTLNAFYDGIIIFLALLNISATPKGFGIILVLMITGIIFNFSYSPVSLYISINGIREILMVICLPVFYYGVFSRGNEDEQLRYIHLFQKFAWFFLIINVSASFSQYVHYGPSDFVGGTYGNFNGGLLTFIIVCLIFFLFQFKLQLWHKMVLVFMLIPLLLNETKVSFILIPMLVMFIFFEPKLKNMLLGAFAGFLFLMLFNQFYSNNAEWGMSSNADIFSADFLQDYLLSDFEDHQDVPRFTKIILGYNIISQETNTLLFGMEYGMFRGTSTGDLSTFSQNWQWLLQGTRPYLFFLLLQGGLTLAVGFFVMILKINNFFKRTTKHAIFYFIVFIITLVYQDMFRLHNFSVVYLFMLFFINSEIFKTKAYLGEEQSNFSE